MEREMQAAKRQRVDDGPSTCKTSMTPSRVVSEAMDQSVTELLKSKSWAKAEERVRAFPEEASPLPSQCSAAPTKPSPLALACRLGAPLSCVKAILEACPQCLRRATDARGTPLHEAIVCENVGPDVIKFLIEADEALCETDPPTVTRAALLQDVDGFTPLHLLIRRRFQSNILTDHGLIQMLEKLVKSCPKVVVVPDRGEYEEPPIVYALKANLYAPMLGSEDETTARVERRIYEMVACMLEHYPEAACCVFAGYRGYVQLVAVAFGGWCTYVTCLFEWQDVTPSSLTFSITYLTPHPAGSTRLSIRRCSTDGLLTQLSSCYVQNRGVSQPPRLVCWLTHRKKCPFTLVP